MQLPDAFLEKMNQLLGEDYGLWLESFREKSFRGLRVNTSKIKVEEFEKISPFPLEKIPWIPNGFYLPEEADASRHPYYAAGLYYLQEPSAMTPASCLPVEKGERVLDLCAAPGGKATELAARLQGTGLLVANDISNSRAKGLLKNLELFGSPNILVTSETPERLAVYFPEFFDKILIDAPCSGEGMFRKEPSMIKDWREHGPEHYAPIQRGILLQAAKLLRPGGMLLYSTCTFSEEENEGSIAYFLEQEKQFATVPLPAYEGFTEGRRGLTDCVRIYPHKMRGEGHFAALLRKAERPGTLPEERDGRKTGIGRAAETGSRTAECPEWEEFAKELGISADPGSLRFHEKKLYSLPEELQNRNIRGLRFLRTGLYLGEAEKKRFAPSQALAMALRRKGREERTGALPEIPEKYCLDFSLSDERVIRYLKGESPDVEDLLPSAVKGWRLVCVDGFPLGWGKIVNGSLRNKYYPGWRWQ